MYECRVTQCKHAETYVGQVAVNMQNIHNTMILISGTRSKETLRKDGERMSTVKEDMVL